MATENVQRLTREPRYQSPTVERFQSEESLRARVGKGRTRPQPASDDRTEYSEEITNDNFFQTMLGNGEELGISALKKAVPLTRVSLGWELSIASFCSFWQFVFGIWALVFLIGGNYELLGISGDEMASFLNTWVGGSVVGVVNFVGQFFGFHIGVPPITFTAIGFICWGITLLFTLGGYGVITLLLRVQQINLFESIELAILTLAALSLDLIFVTQIFPWMLLWVAVIHLSNLKT